MAPGHVWNESAAWNVAVGAGYLFIALRRTRPVGLVPMLTAFVGMLLLLSVNDLTGGRVKGPFQGDSEALLLGAGAMIGQVEALLDESVDIDRPVLSGPLT